MSLFSDRRPMRERGGLRGYGEQVWESLRLHFRARGSSAVEQPAHTRKVEGSTPSPATLLAGLVGLALLVFAGVFAIVFLFSLYLVRW